MLIISGPGDTRTELSSSFHLPSLIDRLFITEKSTVEITSSLTVGTLIGDGSGTIIVSNNATLTIQKFDNDEKGSQINFLIEYGASLLCDNDLYVNSESPLLEIKGFVKSKNVVIGKHGTLKVFSGASLFTESLKSEQMSKVLLEDGCRVGKTLTSLTLKTLVVGFKSNLTTTHTNLTIAAKNFQMMSSSKFFLAKATREPSWLNIESERIHIGHDAVLSMDRQGRENCVIGKFRGASHGGDGSSNPGSTYGSLRTPILPGCGTQSSAGGGVIYLHASQSLVLDGSITSRGANSSTGGGASGGSVKINTPVLSGSGLISTDGGWSTFLRAGKGGGGGGGGGGRIAVKARDMNLFIGKLTAEGGKGTEAGASGTIYLNFFKSGKNVHKIQVWNSGQTSNAVTDLSDDLPANFVLDIRNNVTVAVPTTIKTLSIEQIDGDFTGTILVSDNQFMEIATKFGTKHPYALKCKVRIASKGMVKFPSKLLLTDSNILPNDSPNLEVKGTIIGVLDMVVASGSRVSFSTTARTGVNPQTLDPIATLSFTNLTVTSNGLLEFGLDNLTPLNLLLHQSFNIMYKGTVHGRYLQIETSDMALSYNGLLSADSLGHLAGKGKGAGAPGNGASYGGTGGIAGTANPSPFTGQFGSIFTASSPGSGGGNTSSGVGGPGGGVLRIRSKNTFSHHGKISSNGGSANKDAGGGSGGSIYIETKQLVGTGEVSTSGGAGGEKLGGGGAGGRIVVQLSAEDKFIGTYVIIDLKLLLMHFLSFNYAYNLFREIFKRRTVSLS